MNDKNNFKSSWFFKLFLDNKVATAFAIILLFLVNLLLLTKLSFMFQPIGDFLGVIMLPIILAAVFYYLLNPIVDYFEVKKVTAGDLPDPGIKPGSPSLLADSLPSEGSL